MMNDLITLLADVPMSESPSAASPLSTHPDPLIDQGAQITIYIGTALLVLSVAAVVGFFSRRVEHALVTALILSLFLVAFLALSR